MTCDEVARVVRLDTLVEEIGGERALGEHARGCDGCRAAIEEFLTDEALLRSRFAAVRRRVASRRALFVIGGFAAALIAAATLLHVARGRDVARVVSLRGGASADDRALAAGGCLRAGTLVTSGADSTVTLELDDGSTVTLAADGALRIGAGRDVGAALALERGRLHCEVRPDRAAFRIATPRGEIVAVGTEFDVAYTPARDDSAARPETGVRIMTTSGGLPKVALLTVAVLAGAVELRFPGRITSVRAQEMLVASGDEEPRVVAMTGGASPTDVPAFDAKHVHSVQRMVSALALAPDGKHLAICVRQMSGGEIGEHGPRFVGVQFWNLERDQIDGFVPLDGSPSDAVFTPDGRLWATEAMNNELRRLDPAGRRVAESIDLNNPPNLLTSDDARLYPSPDGRRVVVTGFNNSKAVYAYPGWKREVVLEGPADSLPCEGSWNADGTAFVAGSHDDELRLFAFPVGGRARARPVGQGIAPVFGPDGRVYALTTDLTAFGPSEESGGTRRLFTGDHASLDVARFSPDGRLLALGRVDGVVELFDVATRKRLRTFDYVVPDNANGAVSCMLWSPRAGWLAIGRFDGSSCVVRFPVK